MPRRLRTALGGLLAVLATLPASAPPATARAYAVEDLLRTEWFGRTLVDPSGRWAVIERRDPYITAARFDLDYRTEASLGRLLLADLAGKGPARPLLADSEGPGLIAGAFSPSGRRLMVFRLRGDDWRLGVVSIPDGRVTWTEVTPEDPTAARIAEWRGEDDIVVLARPDRSQPRLIRRIRTAPDVVPARWAALARGDATPTVHGSGAWRGVRPRPAPGELRLVDAASGADRTLARGAFSEIAVSPDGSRVAALEAGEDTQPHLDGVLQGPYGYGTRRHALRLVRLDGTRPRTACAGEDVMERLMAWSPDGRGLIVHARAPGARWDAGGLRLVDAAGACAPLAPDGFRPQVLMRPDRVDAGWMGPVPIALGRQGGGPLRWFALDGAARPLTPPDATAPAWSALDRDGGLIVAGRDLLHVQASGEARRAMADVTAGFPGRRNVHPAADLAPAAKAIALVRSGDRGREGGVRTPGGSVRWRRLPAGARLVAASASRDVLLVQVRDARGVERVSVLDAAGRERTLATINGGLAEVAAPRIVPIHHAAPDGRQVTSWLLLPGRDPGAPPPPLIVSPYLGANYAEPRRNTPPMLEFGVDLRTMVGAGYAVLMPSLPRRKDDPEPWIGVADRMLAIVDQAAADPALAGAFDPDRLALWGLSFGGYTVAHAVTQSDRFRAAIVCGAPIDPLNIWGAFQPEWRIRPELGTDIEAAMSWTEDAQLALGGPPWSMPQRYVAANPVYAADRIRTPVLIFHSDQDYLALDNAEMLFSSLYRQDKDAMLVTYWGEGHLTASPGNIRDRYVRAFAFLERHLTPAPAAPPARGP